MDNLKHSYAYKIALGCLVTVLLLSLTACSKEPPLEKQQADAIEKPASKDTPNSNFYAWANRDWLRRTDIPPDKPAINNFIQISNEVNTELQNMLTGFEQRQDLKAYEKKLFDLYTAFTDIETRNRLGISPLKPYLDSIASANSIHDIAPWFAKLQILGVSSPLIMQVMADFKHSESNIVYITQGGLFLQRDNYLQADERSKKLRSQYQSLLSTLFELGGFKNAEEKAIEVLAIETALAEAQWSKVENRNLEKIYNITDFKSLKTSLANVYFAEQLQELGMPDKYPFNAMQPSYLEFLNNFMNQPDIQSWKSYLTARLLLSYGMLMSTDFKAALLNYEIERGLYEKESPLQEQAIDYINNNAGMLLGRAYVENTFDESTKALLKEIITNIVAEYRVAINESGRMSKQTKAKALEKLNKMKFKIGYPDEWRDYSSLQINPGNMVQNHINIGAFESKRNIAKLGQPIDENDWDYPPQIVNAFYDPTKNTFVLLAGILHSPFFSKDGGLAEQYGSIGFVIGHEIGHGFDDQGSKFDSEGNMLNWWAESDAAAYQIIKDELITAANSYELFPGKFLNGALEIGEILGDVNGAEISFRAYKKALPEEARTDQAYREFFIRLAKTWRSKIRKDMALILLEKDPHPPSEYRTNGIVPNFDEFHTAFGIQAGDPMFLPPERRIKLW